MPAPVLGAIGKFIFQAMNIQVWPEEVPRTDVNGNAVNPQSNTAWPVVQLFLERKSPRENTFEDSYSENPPIILKVWGDTRAQVHNQMAAIEATLNLSDNWAYQNSPIGQAFATMGFPQFWLYDLQMSQWDSGQEENERLFGSQLLWLAEMNLWVGLHGSLASG